MYDSVVAADLPEGGNLYAGYVSGAYPDYDAIVARFPGVPVVSIATEANVNNGVCLDVENYDATPAQAPGWVQMRREANVDPTVYIAEANWNTLKAAFVSAGVAPPHYWVAAYPGAGATVPAAAVAHQYAEKSDYDISVVVDYWPGVDPPPVPTPTEVLNMDATDPTSGGFWVFFPSDGHVEAYGGAPYLGAVNNHVGSWAPVGIPMGFCAQNSPSAGGWGYNVTYLLPEANAAGEWCANYFFPRDGAENPAA